ncbi:hypothetical protein [Micromonospora sp. 4G55]|uniref:hypothetical protein n=1 Tax=Micromonospora sp. 4G55 TaxID=2806102 RepID=UPI001EE3DB68|nr:hypothetical protein [Micromonospora sp. 4G55]
MGADTNDAPTPTGRYDMKRRTLDLLFSIGGLGLAVLLLIAGIVLTSNANFANDYVREQLGAQHISFKPADQLTDEEKKADCLVEYAGQRLTTGKQAERYRGAGQCCALQDSVGE